MNAIAVSKIGVHVNKPGSVSVHHRRQMNWTAALIISASLGALSGVCGIVIGAASLLGLTHSMKGISSLTTILIVIAFPLLMLAAHCLDRLDDIEHEIRLEYCREHGLTDDEC